MCDRLRGCPPWTRTWPSPAPELPGPRRSRRTHVSGDRRSGRVGGARMTGLRHESTRSSTPTPGRLLKTGSAALGTGEKGSLPASGRHVSGNWHGPSLTSPASQLAPGILKQGPRRSWSKNSASRPASRPLDLVFPRWDRGSLPEEIQEAVSTAVVEDENIDQAGRPITRSPAPIAGHMFHHLRGRADVDGEVREQEGGTTLRILLKLAEQSMATPGLPRPGEDSPFVRPLLRRTFCPTVNAGRSCARHHGGRRRGLEPIGLFASSEWAGLFLHLFSTRARSRRAAQTPLVASPDRRCPWCWLCRGPGLI